MIRVVNPAILMNYGFHEGNKGVFYKKLPVSFSQQFNEELAMGDEPTLYMICCTMTNKLDDGHEINELYMYTEGMNNDYAGSASLDTIAELLNDGVAIIERGATRNE